MPAIAVGGHANRPGTRRRVIAYDKVAARGPPESMREGSVEPPSRQDAKESIADPVPHAVLEATNSLGVLAPWRFTVVAFSASRLREMPYAMTWDHMPFPAAIASW